MGGGVLGDESHAALQKGARDLWVVTEPTPMPIRYGLSNNIGLGGHNGAVIFKRYSGD